LNLVDLCEDWTFLFLIAARSLPVQFCCNKTEAPFASLKEPGNCRRASGLRQLAADIENIERHYLRVDRRQKSL
jgi:hypothetical protein